MRGPDRSNSGLTRIALLIAILISSVLISVQRGDDTRASRVEVASQETAAPLARLLAPPLRGIENFFASLEDRSTAFTENETLREELAILRERQTRYDNLAHKVARYEAILGVDTETDVPLKKIAARAIGESNGPFVRSLLLNVGSKDGVKIGNPVLSTQGLIGHVINTGPSTTRVLLLSDLNSRIAIESARSEATAILAGDNTAQPKLSFINQRENWAIGDRVISSGDDGALPRGLDVGVVVLGEKGEMRIALSSQAARYDWVWVSPFEKIVAPSEEDLDSQEQSGTQDQSGSEDGASPEAEL